MANNVFILNVFHLVCVCRASLDLQGQGRSIEIGAIVAPAPRISRSNPASMPYAAPTDRLVDPLCVVVVNLSRIFCRFARVPTFLDPVLPLMIDLGRLLSFIDFRF